MDYWKNVPGIDEKYEDDGPKSSMKKTLQGLKDAQAHLEFFSDVFGREISMLIKLRNKFENIEKGLKD